MKRGATKEEIIRTTLDLITRNGLRAVRVDEIAQMLGISKRTLYEMFADKNDLISACLNDMARQQRQKKPLGRCVFVKNFYICVVEVSPMMKRSATYGFRQLPEAMPMMSMMSMRSRSGRA